MASIPAPRWLLVGLAALATPAAAQQSGPDIVIDGERDDRSPFDIARARARAISHATGGQLARFNEPVCAASVNLPEAYNRRIVARIAAVAREAGIAVAPPGCRVNVTVIAVESGQRTLQALYKVRPALFAAIGDGERKRLLADPGPVHVVTFTELRGRDGSRLGGGRPSSAGPAGTTFAELPTLLVESASILNPATRQDIGGALVLIDQAALVGKTLGQIADYAAMRALARTRPANADGDTILSLFDAGATPPPALTAFDRAYLAGLYRGPATRSAGTQVGTIARGIVASGSR